MNQIQQMIKEQSLKDQLYYKPYISLHTRNYPRVDGRNRRSKDRQGLHNLPVLWSWDLAQVE
jgi:hypothetical protein